MKFNAKVIGFLLAGLVLLPSCMRVRKYRPQSLKMLRDKAMHTETKNNVTVRAKRLNDFEKEYLFNKRLNELEDNPFQVIYLSITNMSSMRYELLPNSITLERVAYPLVLGYLKKTTTVGRAVASGLAASYGLVVGINMAREMVIPGSGILVIIFVPIVGIASVVSLVTGIRAAESWKTNQSIDNDLKEKMLAEAVILEPYCHCEGLIFVKSSDFRPNFTVTIHEKDNIPNLMIFDANI